MELTQREKNVFSRAVMKLKGTKLAKTDRDVKQAMNLILKIIDDPEVAESAG